MTFFGVNTLSFFNTSFEYDEFLSTNLNIAHEKLAEVLMNSKYLQIIYLFHFFNAKRIDSFSYSYLIEKTRGVKNAVKPLLLDEFLKTVACPVRYPKFGGLKVIKTEKELGLSF
jgi:hypothetical protein